MSHSLAVIKLGLYINLYSYRGLGIGIGTPSRYKFPRSLGKWLKN
jgi:hypothetical protein